MNKKDFKVNYSRNGSGLDLRSCVSMYYPPTKYMEWTIFLKFRLIFNSMLFGQNFNSRNIIDEIRTTSNIYIFVVSKPFILKYAINKMENKLHE